MQNLWDVIHRLIDGEPLSDAEKAMAHGLTETHLAQHVGIAREQGEHREKLLAHENSLKAAGMLTGDQPAAVPAEPVQPA